MFDTGWVSGNLRSLPSGTSSAVDGTVAYGGDHDRSEDPAAALTRLRSLVERTRPVSTADQRVLPVPSEVKALLASHGLRRGTVVQIDGATGATSMALALAAGPSRAGSWVACVGTDELGWASAAELGVDMEHLVVVRTEPESWATVTAALVDAFDIVLCCLDQQPSTTQARRLQARARERGAVVVVVGGHRGGVGSLRRAWPYPTDLVLTIVEARWQGLGEGWGHLRSRRVIIEISGRRDAARRRRVELLLPGPGGSLELIADRSGADLPAAPGSSAAGAVLSLPRTG